MSTALFQKTSPLKLRSFSEKTGYYNLNVVNLLDVQSTYNEFVKSENQ